VGILKSLLGRGGMLRGWSDGMMWSCEKVVMRGDGFVWG